MQARMTNPATILPAAMPAILKLFKTTKEGGVPEATLELATCARARSTAAALASTLASARPGRRARATSGSSRWRPGGSRLLHRRRTSGAGAHRGRHPAQRPSGPGTGRGLGRGRPSLRRAGARGPGPHDRRDQPVQPPQRHHQAGRGHSLVAERAWRLAHRAKKCSPSHAQPAVLKRYGSYGT